MVVSHSFDFQERKLESFKFRMSVHLTAAFMFHYMLFEMKRNVTCSASFEHREMRVGLQGNNLMTLG